MKLNLQLCDFCREERPIMAHVEVQLPGYRIDSRICGDCRKNGAVPVTVEGILRRWADEDTHDE